MIYIEINANLKLCSNLKQQLIKEPIRVLEVTFQNRNILATHVFKEASSLWHDSSQKLVAHVRVKIQRKSI